MICAKYIDRTSLDTRSSGDHRCRVDAYFVIFDCPPDDANPCRHEWVCRFEVERGTPFSMSDFQTKAEAHKAKGWKL